MSFRTPYPYYWGQQQFTVDRLKSPRVVVINETDPGKSDEKMADWLVQHYPGFKLIQLATVKQNNRIHNRATIQTANGKRMVILFDIHSSYQNNMRTTVRVFPGGTMVRINPRTTSTPTRMQILL